MFIFGHLGIGSKIVSPWSVGLPKRWLLFGTLLPDLIDKPVYYGLSLFTGLKAADLGLISGTRTFGHTGILLLLITILAVAKRSRVLAAIALGTATHLLLDNISDAITGHREESSAFLALVFPLMGARFGIAPFQSASEHLSRLHNMYTLIAEALGLGILLWDRWKNVHQGEILSVLQNTRIARRRRKHEVHKKDHLR